VCPAAHDPGNRARHAQTGSSMVRGRQQIPACRADDTRCRLSAHMHSTMPSQAWYEATGSANEFSSREMRFNECETANERCLASRRRLASVPLASVSPSTSAALFLDRARRRLETSLLDAR
jgi:hypothetical protein